MGNPDRRGAIVDIRFVGVDADTYERERADKLLAAWILKRSCTLLYNNRRWEFASLLGASVDESPRTKYRTYRYW